MEERQTITTLLLIMADHIDKHWVKHVDVRAQQHYCYSHSHHYIAIHGCYLGGHNQNVSSSILDTNPRKTSVNLIN